MLPVWSEPQGTTNDQTKLQSRLPNGACVRVLSTRAHRPPLGRGRSGIMLVSLTGLAL
jgi:hypothetical protein